MTDVIDLPIIVNGVSHHPDGDPETTITLTYESGLQARLPRFTRDHLAQITAAAPEIDAALAKLTTAEIITFLGEVGERWDARGLRGRMLVREWGHRFSQFSDVMMERDYETIGHFLLQRWHSYDQIESEFGDQRIFDEWIPVQMSYRRAFPRGLVLHYLVGNLPLASLYSLCRGMITKNRSIAKLPSRDPVSALGLALAVQEVDPDHPVTRALNLVYWPHDDVVGDEAIALSDAACVWGGRRAVESVRGKLGVNVPLAEFGPRWSASVVDLAQADADEAAMRVVDDAAFYDQEACFNTQRVFVTGGDLTAFAERLMHYLGLFGRNLPFVTTNRDILANRSALLAEAAYRGFEVRATDDAAVVVLPADVDTMPHPLGRTVFVHPVDDLADVARHLDRDTQTLSVFPWTLTTRFRDTWGAAGAERMVEAGFSRMPRAGFTHDGTLGMHAMVRLACIERSWNDPGRYYTRRTDPARHYLIDRYERVRQTMAEDQIASGVAATSPAGAR